MALLRVDGVEDAKVLFPSGAASVVYDASLTSPEEFIGELARMTGFEATVTIDRTDFGMNYGVSEDGSGLGAIIDLTISIECGAE